MKIIFGFLPKLHSILDLHQVLYATKGEISDLSMMTGMAYRFWIIFVGK